MASAKSSKPMLLEQPPASITFVVDLSNVLYASRAGRRAKLANFKLLKKALATQFPGTQSIFVVDAWIRHVIDETDQYETLVKQGEIIQTPPTEKADYYVLEYARKKPNCVVISCDQFKDYPVADDLRRRVIPFVIMGEEVIFSPKLQNCICG